MPKTIAIVIAAVSALVVHALFVLFGGIIVSPSETEPPTKVTPVELRATSGKSAPPPTSAPKSVPEPEAGRALETPPEPAEPVAEVGAEAPPADAAPEAPAQSTPPPLAETPKSPEATATTAQIAKHETREAPPTPQPQEQERRPEPDLSPAQIAAAQARDATVQAPGGEVMPVVVPIPTAAATTPTPNSPTAEDAQRALGVPSTPGAPGAPGSRDAPGASGAPVAPLPSDAPVAPAEVAVPAPRSLAPTHARLRTESSPARIGPAWSAAAAKIGRVPQEIMDAPAAGPTSPRRARQIPPVDIAAATTRASIPYRPLNLGARDTQAGSLPVVASSRDVPATIGVASAATGAGSSDKAPVAARTGTLSGAQVATAAGIGRGPMQGGQTADRGSLAPGARVRPEPVARIAWGSAQEASQAVDIGRMRLVAVDDDLKVVAGISGSGASWSRTPPPPEMGVYSNRVRVVDHVAGFSAQAELCGSGEHLAVIVPVGLDRRIERAMDKAAWREGLTRDQVAACYGRLVTHPTGMEFEVDRVERRTQQ